MAWWKADLDKVYFVASVVTYNRADCCSDRLANYQVYVGNDEDFT